MICVFCHIVGVGGMGSTVLVKDLHLIIQIQHARNIRFPRLTASSLTAPGGTGVGEGRVIGPRAPQRTFSQAKDSLIFHDKNTT